jgi:hypothetical protein
VKLSALVTLLERAYGKPKQAIEHSGEIAIGIGMLFEAMEENEKKLKLLA